MEWDPKLGIGALQVPEWVKAFFEMGLAASEFMAEGFFLGLDLVGVLLAVVDKAIPQRWACLREPFGKKLGDALDWLSGVLDKFLPDFFLTPGWVKERIARQQSGNRWPELQSRKLSARCSPHLPSWRPALTASRGMAAVVRLSSTAWNRTLIFTAALSKR